MPRFLCPSPRAVGALVQLPDNVARHVHVIRLPPGAMVTLFNGAGGEYSATLVSVEKNSASAEVKAFSDYSVELPYAITLVQALPEAAKMDWIIEKAVELGVAGIQPVAAQRCVVRLSSERAEKRQSHWQAVIQAASEQSGRNRLAHLAPVCDVAEWIERQDLHRRVLLTPRADASLSDWAKHQPAQALALMVGPEGGFNPAEERRALEQGAIGLSMGPRVLRTETAGLAALATLVAAWGEARGEG